MSLHDVLIKLRSNLNNKKSIIKSYQFRRQQLKLLKLFLNDNELIIQEALKNDLGRSPFEGIG